MSPSQEFSCASHSQGPGTNCCTRGQSGITASTPCCIPPALAFFQSTSGAIHGNFISSAGGTSLTQIHAASRPTLNSGSALPAQATPLSTCPPVHNDNCKGKVDAVLPPGLNPHWVNTLQGHFLLLCMLLYLEFTLHS